MLLRDGVSEEVEGVGGMEWGDHAVGFTVFSVI